MRLPVEQLEECPRVQVRKATNADAVNRYLETYQSGGILPPLIVYREPGTERYLIADGHHRLRAAHAAGLKEIDVELREGDETAALEHALGANHEHGLPRTKADIKNGVRLLMTNPTLRAKYRTHEERADLLKISRRTFQSYLAEWREEDDGTDETVKAAARRSAESKTREITPEQRKVAEQVRESVKPSVSKARHTMKGADASNLYDFEDALDKLASFPMSGVAAAEKYLTEVRDFDVDRVRRAHELLGEFLEACGQ